MHARLLTLILLISFVASCKKGDPIVEDPIVEDPVVNDTTSSLPVINAETHRLIGRKYSQGDYKAWVTSDFFEYDAQGRCVSYSSRGRDVVLDYWDDWTYTFTWDGDNIMTEHYESSSDIDFYETERYYTYSKVGNETKRAVYDAEDDSILGITWWVEGEPTISRTVQYHYDWQIGLYDSTIVFYEDNGFNKYSRYEVRQGDTTLVRTEKYDTKGRLTKQTTGGNSTYRHYYNTVKNPYPKVKMFPNQVFDRYMYGVEEYGVVIFTSSETPAQIFANGDLPQLSVNAEGDTVYFVYEEL